MSFSWLSRNVLQLCEGDPLYRTKYLLTVDSLISIPSFISSPWILGALQSGSSRLIRPMSRRISIRHGW